MSASSQAPSSPPGSRSSIEFRTVGLLSLLAHPTGEANVQATQAHSSRSLDTTLAEAAMVITEAGKPMMCSPVDPADREPGAAAGKARLTDAFFEPLPAEVLTDFKSDPT